MDDKGEMFHVGINNPDDIRRAILESSKQAVFSLQRFEKIKAIREDKAVLTTKIKDQIAELFELIFLLKKELPKTQLRNAPPKTIEPLEIEDEGSNELDRLELDLKGIERKLNSI